MKISGRIYGACLFILFVRVCVTVTPFVTTMDAVFFLELIFIAIITAIVSIIAIGTVDSLVAVFSVIISRCTMLVLV